MKNDTTWVFNAKGKVIKVISALLKELPKGYNYKIIFMLRKMDEILASQKKMLIRRGEPTDKISDELMAKEFEKHLKKIDDWLDKQHNMDVLYVTYHEAVANPIELIIVLVMFIYGLVTMWFAIRGKEISKLMGDVRTVAFLLIMFTPVLFRVVPFDIVTITAMIFSALVFYIVVEIVFRLVHLKKKEEVKED